MKFLFSYTLFLCLLVSIQTNAQDSTVLKTKDSVLANITVAAQRKAVERKTDRTIVNVDAFISNAGANALEVLEKSPGVQLDNNDIISLKGKQGVVIYIDDKPTYLSGADLANYLKSLPAASLDKIEIMTTPPARYDAAGNAGVINIKTKKTRQQGLNGSLNVSHRQGFYGDTRYTLNFNYRKNKLNIFSNIVHSDGKNFNDLVIERNYYDDNGNSISSFNQRSMIRRSYKSYNVKLGADYSLDKRSTLGIMFTGTYRPGMEYRINRGVFYNAAADTDSIVTAMNSEKEKFSNAGFNINYRNQLDSLGKELSMHADFISYNLNNDQLFNNESFDAGGNLASKDRLTGRLPSAINIFSFKADYVHPLSKTFKMETGFKTSYIKTDNDAQYFIVDNNISTPDYEKTNHFIYDENINALYLNISKEFKKWSLQAALRAEHTFSKGYQAGNAVKPDSSFRRNYVNLFPTFFALYKLDSSGSSNITFSYSRRIGRPYFADLNPFISPLDKFTYYAGNPFLQPQFTHHVEMAYNHKGIFNGSVFFDRVKDEMSETIELDGNIFISRTGNIGKKNVIGASADATLKPAKWWSVLPYVEWVYIHTRSKIYNETVNTKGSFYTLNFTSQFKISKTWSAELQSRYRSKITDGQFVIGEVGHITGSVQKKLMKDKASLKLNITDIFDTRVNKGNIGSLTGGSGYFHNQFDNRAIVLVFTYNFSRGIKTSGNRSNGSAENEMNRVK